ncbi:hypothetical protein C8R43DRAFT_1036948 [Mycena crocata]|nr:hypothetical protein C8R43DRAFT_1036948 [Mycena crocata]
MCYIRLLFRLFPFVAGLKLCKTMVLSMAIPWPPTRLATNWNHSGHSCIKLPPYTYDTSSRRFKKHYWSGGRATMRLAILSSGIVWHCTHRGPK